MNLAIASGKGGTGKTTVAVNLAYTLAESGVDVEYMDCDVEEPNGHIFLRPSIESWETFGIPVPVVDESSCEGCGACAKACRFSAIAALGKKVIVFSELCHGCGGCALACPTGAIQEESKAIGKIERGTAGRVGFVQGRLNVGSALSPPLIRAVQKRSGTHAIHILDAPPGTACPVVATLRRADYVLLVTEPTPFGLHDLRLAVETVRELDLPFGVVINRADSRDSFVVELCRSDGIAVLAELRDERRAAEAYSRGMILVEEIPEFAVAFRRLWERIQEEMAVAKGDS